MNLNKKNKKRYNQIQIYLNIFLKNISKLHSQVYNNSNNKWIK